MRLTLTTLMLPAAFALGCSDTPKPDAAPASAPTPATSTPTAASTPSAAPKSAPLSAFEKYQRKSMTSEAAVNLRMMVDSATAYYMSEHANAAGVISPPQFPPNAPLTPKKPACAGTAPTPAAAVPADWSTGNWAVMSFQPRGKLRYQYQWITDGKTFTARAIGDLDCDGVTSTFEEFGTVTAEGDVQRDPASPRKIRPLE